MSDKPLCIYHGNCVDGFGAAWVVRKFYGPDNVDFHAGKYQETPPDVTGRDVILVDFSYKRQVMETLISQAASVLIIDHHKTAQADLADLPGATVIFDMEHSGAVLAWIHFFGNEVHIPTLITFDNEISKGRTIIESQTEDRLGLLYTITHTLSEMGLDISFAKVSTEKGAAIDTFYVQDQLGNKITDPAHLSGIRSKLESAIDLLAS